MDDRHEAENTHMTTGDAGLAASIDRRGLLAAGAAVGAALAGPTGALAQRQPRGNIVLIADPADPVASSPAAQWALGRLEGALRAAGYDVSRRPHAATVPADAFSIVVAGAPGPADSLGLAPTSLAGRPALLAAGANPRGLAYALTELADRVRADPESALHLDQPLRERPATPVRSVMRQFTSELYDKPWLYDREGWTAYLDTVAAHRWNRVHLAFGQAYDNLKDVQDGYLLFAYPFLVSAPGYDVRVSNLTDEERGRNLATLKFVSDAAAARGLEFQLGLWMHGYAYGPASRAKHVIEGLTPETHAAYCRDALAEILKACPAISAVSLRTHGESGVPEGSYDFWRVVFEGVRLSGRRVEIDLHAKGLDSTMIDLALATGLPVNVSPKYSAEYMALPYQEASIRELEMPVAGRTGEGLMTLSEGKRIATRSSYADFLRDDRRYTVRFRVYPGTQHLLLWGDPASAAAYARVFTFCGATGADVMEPLTYRGRRGTAVPGIPRSGYVDPRLEPGWDWRKYAYWYRVWGRKLYDPQTPPAVFDREFGASEPDRARAASLASASRILPLVTTAHLPSVACAFYWPEVYWNQPMASEPRLPAYPDTPEPKTFIHASTLDPQLFANCDQFAGELLAEARSGKYSPVEVAAWLDRFSADAEHHLKRAGEPRSIEALRTQIDVELQAGLGRFFAGKLRAGVLYAMFARTQDRRALQEALYAYRAARGAWGEVVARARGVYADDLSVSDWMTERGSWKDRLPLIDEDIAQLEQRLARATDGHDPRVAAAVAAVSAPPSRPSIPAMHRPPSAFQPGQPLQVELAAPGATRARLLYRRVDQAEHYQALEMLRDRDVWRASIPAGYTNSPFPLQYYFELRTGPQHATLHPGLGDDLLQRPYFVVRRA
jgi:hypothetical protein